MKTNLKITSRVLAMLIALSLLNGCSKNDELTGEELIKKHELAGTYKIEITPKMMGRKVTFGEHEAKFIDEGNGILRLTFSKFNRPPMPFEMSVDVRMRVKQGANDDLILENIGGDFDANLPEGAGAIDPDKVPPGIELPPEALKKGLHSNGKSTISGKYGLLEDTSLGKQFDLELEPNISLPVTVHIRTIKKLS